MARRDGRHLGIVERLIAVAKDQRAPVVAAHDLRHQRIVALGGERGELLHDAHSRSAWPKVERAAVEELIEAHGSFGLQVCEERVPAATVAVAKKREEAPALLALWLMLAQRIAQQGCVPPAELVIGVVPN